MRRAVSAALLVLMLSGIGVPLHVGQAAEAQPATERAAAAPGAAGESPRAPNRRVLGYYVPYDPASWASLETQAAEIDMVAAQWVTIDGCGRLASQDDQTLKQFARSRGVQVYPSLLTNAYWLNHRLLTDNETAARMVTEIVEYVQGEGYDGFDLDLEAVQADDRDAYTGLVGRLGAALHERGKLLTLALPAKATDAGNGWSAAYDYAALGQYADLITIMAYEFHGAWGGPGPVAPYDEVERSMGFAASQIPPEKVLLGLAFYGFDWNTTSGGARYLGYPEVAALSERYGVSLAIDPASRSATVRYQAAGGDQPPSPPSLPALTHEITRREPVPCSVTEPGPGPTPTPRPTPAPAVMQDHEVWLEESSSAAARLPLADRYQTGGVAAWRLGHEDPAMWTVVERWRRGEP